MIGSVVEQRDQLAALEKRRQEIAAQQAAAQNTAQVPVTNSSPVTAAPLAAGMPGGGRGTAPMAVKAAEPDIAKRRRGKDRADRKGHDDLSRDEATTSALDEGAGYRDAMDDEDSRKSFRDRGISQGPGEPAEPGRAAEAGQFERPYLSEGHSAESPQAEMPRQSPIVHARQGYVQPIALPGAPVAGYVPAHVAQSYSMGSPSERAR